MIFSLSLLRNAKPRWKPLAAASLGSVADGGGVAGSGGGRPQAPADLRELRQLVNEAVRLGRQQAPLPAVAAHLVEAYRGLAGPSQRLAFFSLLAREYGVEHAEVDRAVEAWLRLGGSGGGGGGKGTAVAHCASTATPQAVGRAADALRAATQPQYLQLLLPIAHRHDGIGLLVQMRGDLLEALRERPAYGVALRSVSEALRRHLAEWFSPSLLQLQRVTWEGSSGALLEKVAGLEAVHRMSSWRQLKQRLGPRRRVYCWLHPSMPGEPLVILHTAIMDAIPERMDEIIGPTAVAEADAAGASGRTDGVTRGSVACFYSVTSTQSGLAGVDLGNQLIKRAARLLLADVDGLQDLVTLSPLPGFRAWLLTRLQQQAMGEAAGQPPQPQPATDQQVSSQESGNALRGQPGAAAGQPLGPPARGWAALLGGMPSSQLLAALSDDTHRWVRAGGAEAAALRPLLLRLAAHYLVSERRRNLALDPVANFHLHNGASVWRINWAADMSPAGLHRSWGLMVNYRYALEEVDAQAAAYSVSGHVAMSPAVRELVGEDAASADDGWVAGSQVGAR